MRWISISTEPPENKSLLFRFKAGGIAYGYYHHYVPDHRPFEERFPDPIPDKEFEKSIRWLHEHQFEESKTVSCSCEDSSWPLDSFDCWTRLDEIEGERDA